MRPPAPRNLNILLIDPDLECAEALAQRLRRHGHTVTFASTGAAAVAQHPAADLLLLDPDLTDIDGLEVIRAVRDHGQTPLIVTAHTDNELDRVLSLRSGADDYLTRPFSFQELLARIEAVMRRFVAQSAPGRVLAHGGLHIDGVARQVSIDGCAVNLTRKEFDLLYILASQSDAVVPRRHLISRVWGDTWSKRTIDTHISSLRNKLGDHGGCIVTVRGVGFMFVADNSPSSPAPRS